MRTFAQANLYGRSAGGGGGDLDTQTVTTGAFGTLPDRFRGFDNTLPTGSISDGTSNIYSGASISAFAYDEAGSMYYLSIPGATNSGWTQVVIDGTKTLVRASATSFASGVWTWTTGDTISTQAFGAASSSHTCVFT